MAAKRRLAKSAVRLEHTDLRHRRVEAGLAIARTSDMRDDEPAGIERGHGGLRHIQCRRLLGANRPGRIENLEVNEERSGKTRTPRDDDISVGRAPATIGTRCRPGARVGAKLGAIFRIPSMRITLRADALVRALVGPDDDEAAVGQSAPAPAVSAVRLPRC